MRRGLVVLALCVPAVARADSWLVLEAPVALATSDTQRGLFRPGVMPAVGAYAENDHFALGVRLRGGVLRDGPAPGPNVADPGMGGLTTASVALRIGVRGGWLELAGGGGLTGSDVVPAVEAGVGWAFAVGSVDVGPSARYVRIVSRDPMAMFGTAELALVGVDLRFGREHARRTPVPLPPARVVDHAFATVEPFHDRVIDREVGCVSDATGCPAAEVVEQVSPDVVVRNDRIVLDERVLFDFNRARVRSRGRAVLAQIVQAWREHPDWRRVTVEGHTDVRGSDDYNQWLSEERAQRVRAVMLELGCSSDDISVIGFGRSHPRESGDSEQVHARNRRVEFVIDRSEP